MKYNVTTLFHQGSGKQNEDQLLVNDPIFAVFDGATSLTPAQVATLKALGAVEET